jgi:hypothetical protein
VGSFPANRFGNAGYSHHARLPNVPRDAATMAALFKAAKFDAVEVKHDLEVAALRRTLREFSGHAAGADAAVLLFAGHGIEVDRQLPDPGRCPPRHRPRRKGRDGPIVHRIEKGAGSASWP